MLLIEWGTHHDVFRLSFVRQLTPTGPNDEHTGMYTITVEITFPPAAAVAAIADGNAWLPPTSPELNRARESLPGLRATLGVAPASWEATTDRCNNARRATS